MIRVFRCALFVLTFYVLPALSQTPPCPAGTLANVLGTSCSVGSLTLNFQNRFLGLLSVSEIGGPNNQVPISPAAIGFIPIHQENMAGFKLTTNFVDGPGVDSTSFSVRFVQFSYTPQANPGFDIVGETVQIEATAQSSATDSVSEDVIDFQDYPSIFSTSPDAFITHQNGNLSSHLSDHIFLPAPALLSVGFAGQPQSMTTFLQGLTTGTAQGTLQSATFLYNVGPIGPLPPAALTYSTIDLPGTAATFVSGIANSGKMTGAFQDGQGGFHGYVTDGKDGFVTIDFPNATGTFGGGLNNRGDVVGSYTAGAGNTHGFLLQGEDFTTFDFPGALFTNALGINDRGQIVGLYETPDQGLHGFLLDHGIFTSIDHNPGNFFPPVTQLFGINNRGQMVGTFLDSIALVGLLQLGDSFQTLFVPGQVDMVIEALNDQGEQVGTYNDINGLLHGFASKDEQFLTVDFPGGNSTFPLGINAAGKIVGTYSDAAGNFHSFLAQRQGIGDNGPNAASNPSSLNPAAAGTSQPAPPRICGSAEWRQHPEQMRNAARCQVMQQSHQGVQ